MYAVEFNAKIDSGIIKIPDKYIKNLGRNVKVIILNEELSQERASIGFNSIRLKTKGFKFDREAANER